ncbi:sulfotransferase family protein [Dolichospermum circinale]|uniref:sulfotransferase family protein n=1 Tax=Dolichospermum circinale TaxID=109265 RepID=UPI00040CB287|nr:sulfotransferase [Dolichospermum circinale]MDB9482442.1 sulfotransferase [Dolichospermum circinale CS-537/05]MDB9455964.1 sulfotransferase [Dolichospermum circinale CS-541/06]MDB9464742.1 sulfotransferase [Dolichospermum circinale CS-541/04]MDB9473177.1 sulfotransferase [Dolichospermum circinale CS-537/11]MDB9479181.1 sulfotransferase [Dolichospermum circinale CS-537/03]
MKKPNLFVVGAPKCGTTSMHNYLGQHPEIFMSSQKEPHYFSRDIDCFAGKIKEISNYLQLFDSAGNAKYIGESSPEYLYSEVAAQQIKEFCSDAKIIIMLRNPPDMLYSLHGDFLLWKDEDILDFGEALAAQEERKKGSKLPKSRKEIKFLLYFDWVKYSAQVRRYLQIFGKENLHIILFNEFVKDTAKTYRQTLEFLGVDPNFPAEIKVKNPSKPLPNIAVRSFFCKYPHFVNKLESSSYADLVKFLFYDIGKFGQPQRPKKIDPELRLKLMKHFQREIEELANLLNWDEQRLQLWLQ